MNDIFIYQIKFIQMWKREKIAILFILCAAIHFTQCHMPNDDSNAVFTVSHTRTFRKQFISDSLGAGKKVAYSSYTYPEGARDALYIFNNGHIFGVPRVSVKDSFAKVLGWGQDYKQIEGKGKTVGQKIPGDVRIHNIIVDWKKFDGDLVQAKKDLDDMLRQMTSSQVFLKVPASLLCKDVNGQPYILSLKNVKNIIVEMYGEDSNAYKSVQDIFTNDVNSEPTTSDYPSQQCPKFPSYAMLIANYPNINFYIQKTLQTFQNGYLGAEFDKILGEGRSIYGANKNIFYDSFPPNLIHL